MATKGAEPMHSVDLGITLICFHGCPLSQVFLDDILDENSLQFDTK